MRPSMTTTYICDRCYAGRLRSKYPKPWTPEDRNRRAFRSIGSAHSNSPWFVDRGAGVIGAV